MRRLAVLGLLISTLCSCAAPGPISTTVVEPASVAGEVSRQQLAALPGALLADGEPLSISYPEQVLFYRQAALPLPGGITILEPLADLLSSQSGSRWQGRVRAETGLGANYDRRLAEGRARLLQSYFQGRGVPAERLQFEAEAAAGPPLELLLLR